MTEALQKQQSQLIQQATVLSAQLNRDSITVKQQLNKINQELNEFLKYAKQRVFDATNTHRQICDNLINEIEKL